MHGEELSPGGSRTRQDSRQASCLAPGLPRILRSRTDLQATTFVDEESLSSTSSEA